MKVAMQQSISIAANSTNNNVIAQQRYERPPFNAIGSLYATGSAAGLTAELNVAGNSITPPVTVNAQNRIPVVPDDLLLEGFEVPADSLLQLTVVNTTGGALTFFWKIELEVIEGTEY